MTTAALRQQWRWQALVMALVALLAALLAATMPGWAAPKVFRITIAGEGRVQAAPDVAIVDVRVWTRAATAAQALRENNARMAKVMEALRGKWKVAEKDLQTVAFSVRPAYEREKDKPPRLVGYDVRNSLRIRVRKLDDLGGILDEVVRLGVNGIDGIRFVVSEREKLLNEARRKAIAAAKARAQLYAEAAGLKLGPIVSLTEDGAVMPPPRPMMRRMAAVAAAAPVPVPVARGEQEIRAVVRITWEVWQE